ncbi:M50 family metallopeptidase [Paenibacillus gansuensis]|uniref:M50 family metallopeptidase n=1 Tax=Paenibacillus gansuensis TaxID=306542 RepID=A0ABW5PDK8_9BACL
MINLFGIRYKFHPLFVVMMLLSLVTGLFLELLTLFAIVFIHELGHAAAARAYGWNVTEIMLLPFGGVAAVDDPAGAPAGQDVVVALAGPLQNLLMAGFGLWFGQMGWWSESWTDYFVTANVMIGAFNLLPVLPLDGGRILHTLLGFIFPYHRTLLICAWVSLALGAGLTLLSLGGYGGKVQLNFFILGLFLVYSNWYGYLHAPYHFLRYMMYRERRSSRMVQRGTSANPIVVRTTNTVSQTAKLFMREKYHLIYVLGEQDQIVRVLPEHVVTRFYYLENKPGSAVSELFM